MFHHIFRHIIYVIHKHIYVYMYIYMLVSMSTCKFERNTIIRPRTYRGRVIGKANRRVLL